MKNLLKYNGSIEIDFFDSSFLKLKQLYHVTRGHSQGEIEEIFLLLTSYAIYVLLRNETNSVNLFKKEAVINHNEIDYIEVFLFSLF